MLDFVTLLMFESVFSIIMPNKCGVVNCKGNDNEANKCRVFKIPKDELERQKWLAVLPHGENLVLDPAK